MTRRTSRSIARPLRAFVAVVVGALLLSSCNFSVFSLPLPGGPDTGDDPIRVSAQFRDVMDLVPQSNVKVDDVDVGRITAIRADGYTAVVDMELRSDVDIPADAFARIRQTSLLGEKFISLEAPEGSSGEAQPLADGAEIPLERTGRNPEVEEVLGALSLLLNGGGIGQLQIIASELNNALDGREPQVRSALQRLDRFATVADDNKEDIVAALDRLNALSESANEQTDTIELALDELPSATLSLDRQRDDLVNALTALDRLSTVGVRVIRASKQGTIRSLELLQPVLRQLANADDDLAFALQTFLTFPFVDETVGRDPQVARSIEFGDYVNLDIQLDLRLGSVGDLVDVVCDEIDSLVLKRLIESGLPIDQVRALINALCDSEAVDEIQECLDNVGSGGAPTLEDILGCVGGVAETIPDLIQCDILGSLLPGVCGDDDDDDEGSGPGIDLPGTDDPLIDLPGRGGGNGDGGLLGGGGGGGILGGGGGGGLLGGGRGGSGGSGSGGSGGSGGTNDNGGSSLLGGLLGRTAPNAIVSGTELSQSWYRMSDLTSVYDPDLTMLLVPGLSRVTAPAELVGGSR